MMNIPKILKNILICKMVENDVESRFKMCNALNVA